MEKIIIQKCKKCGKQYYPHKIRCSCGSTDFEEETLETEGKILTYTTIYVPPKGFTPPLSIGIAEFGSLKLLGRLEDNNIKTGDTVKAYLKDGIVFFKKQS